MKKTIIAILAVLYMTIASGVVVNVHYCMGRIASIEYGYDDHDVCGKCGMKDKKGCCHTEYKLVKLQDEHRVANKVQMDFPPLVADLPVQASLIEVPPSGIDRGLARQYHSPPDTRSNTVYLHNCVFRI